MNVLILTPDRVGSTLLQRLLTVYMVAHEFDRPVINLHELTNGLIKYYSPTFNAEVLGKSKEQSGWKYHQSLEEIVELLESVEHYKTARLAKYHINRRQDKLEDQIPFYQYLNDEFHIISARRENLLEHALSWCIYTETKTLNVFRHIEKVNIYKDLYKNPITVQPEILERYLDQYVEYLKWVDDNFTVNSIFQYDRDMPNIEEYILGLSIFKNQPVVKTWQEIFNIDFKDWNKCHYLISDLTRSTLPGTAAPLLLPKTASDQSYILQALEHPSNLTVADQNFLVNNGKQYVTAYNALNELVQSKVLPSPVPIKLQTMTEKKMLLKNFDELVEVYNRWVEKNKVGTPYTTDDIDAAMEEQAEQWHVQQLLK